jgi:hypothetical protein
MKYNATTLQKHEKVLEDSGYIVRYEKGNFQSGYCVLEQRKVVVVNKFLNVESRINSLSELIPLLKIDIELLSPESLKIMNDLKKNAASKEEAPQ